MAGDAGKISRALIATFEALSRGDAEAVSLEVLESWAPLAGGGIPMIDGDRLEEAFAAGLRVDVVWARLHVQCYGVDDEIAVARGRLEGRICLPGGRLLEGPWEYYRVWRRQPAGWLPERQPTPSLASEHDVGQMSD